jgi:Dcp1-like decapping family
MVELDVREQKLLNLRVLQRRDAAVTDILGQCNHVTLYTFEPHTKKWDRKDVEGVMFLLQR